MQSQRDADAAAWLLGRGSSHAMIKTEMSSNPIVFLSKTASREIRLASRPNGMQNQKVLVRNLFMSVAPYMRGRMNHGKSYVPPFELGKPLDGGAVGEVIESRAKEFKPGDAVTSNFGWREYFMASPKELHPVSREVSPLSVYLGALGITGMTAWVGLNLIVCDWLDRQGEFEKEGGGYSRAGKLKNKETVVEGIDKTVGAFLGLFHGQNVGKMVVKLI